MRLRKEAVARTWERKAKQEEVAMSMPQRVTLKVWRREAAPAPPFTALFVQTNQPGRRRYLGVPARGRGVCCVASKLQRTLTVSLGASAAAEAGGQSPS